MSSPEHKAIPLDAEMEKQRAELASIVHRHTWEDGSYGTAITTLFLNRHNTPRDFMPVLVEPALCILASGSKEVRLADEIFAYDPLNYLVFSVAMPVAGRIIDATPEDPNLSVRINIDPAQLTALIAEAARWACHRARLLAACTSTALMANCWTPYCDWPACWIRRKTSPCSRR